ncbi:hypothetical protein DM02DRAFT_727501 [Periconia macrospinosa]|uniref:RING-type domain-containing protein n=1 Tax=Periconia macrospinosa TaxID=97972 RepID=A0A2V1DUU6_9PLEO|nr:hypothetical protein DM02DRAFT_727501 [Periconia macrospinosa]
MSYRILSDASLNRDGAGRQSMEYRIRASNIYNEEAAAPGGGVRLTPFRAFLGEENINTDGYDADDEEDEEHEDDEYDEYEELDVAVEMANSVLDTALEEVREWLRQRPPVGPTNLDSDARTFSALDFDDLTTDTESTTSEYEFEDTLDDAVLLESDPDFSSTSSSPSNLDSEDRRDLCTRFLSRLPVANRSVDGAYEDCFCGEAYGSLCHAPLVLPCHHVFGRKCLREWIKSGNQNSNTCPMCRRELFERPARVQDF